jgi:hypothetical protein
MIKTKYDFQAAVQAALPKGWRTLSETDLATDIWPIVESILACPTPDPITPTASPICNQADRNPDVATKKCTCGDDEDEHGQDPVFPGFTACNADDCACDFFEWEGSVSETYGPSESRSPTLDEVKSKRRAAVEASGSPSRRTSRTRRSRPCMT